MEVLIPIAIFAGKALIVVLALVAVIVVIALMTAKNKHHETLDLEILNRHYKDFERNLKSVSLPEHLWKEEKKSLKILIGKPTRLIRKRKKHSPTVNCNGKKEIKVSTALFMRGIKL